MTLDSEDHRIVLLGLIKQAAFPGDLAEKVVELKAAVINAVLAPVRLKNDIQEGGS